MIGLDATCPRVEICICTQSRRASGCADRKVSKAPNKVLDLHPSTDHDAAMPMPCQQADGDPPSFPLARKRWDCNTNPSANNRLGNFIWPLQLVEDLKFEGSARRQGYQHGLRIQEKHASTASKSGILSDHSLIIKERLHKAIGYPISFAT